MDQESRYLNSISNANFFKKRKQEKLQDELNMLSEYVDEFAQHPMRSQFFDEYLLEISFEGYNFRNEKDIWYELSLQEKIGCYRQYIDHIGENEDCEIKHPEANGWYDDWLTYSHADP